MSHLSQILEAIDSLIADKKCEIVFAAESGSRPWGFASTDSDYDIRFIYVGCVAHYLSLQETALDRGMSRTTGDLDLAGWDLRRALQLAKKSNPSLIEWLSSDTVYIDNFNFKSRLKTIMADSFSPKALAYHYTNFMRNVKGKEVADISREPTIKRYFYALRPILTVLWMQEHPFKLPPIHIEDLLSQDLISDQCKHEIIRLLGIKREGKELDAGSSPIIEKFIQAWFDQGRGAVDNFPARAIPEEKLESLFYDVLTQVYYGDGLKLVYA